MNNNTNGHTKRVRIGLTLAPDVAEILEQRGQSLALGRGATALQLKEWCEDKRPTRTEIIERAVREWANREQQTDRRRPASITLNEAQERQRQVNELPGASVSTGAKSEPFPGQAIRVRSTDRNMVKASEAARGRQSCCEHGAAPGLCKVTKCRRL